MAISIQSRHSLRTVPTKRSAIALPLGASTGVRDDLDALGAEDLVERAAELGVVVAQQEAHRTLAVLQTPGQIPCLLGDPGAAEVLRHASKMDPTGRDLDEEEDVDPSQGDGVDGEEVAGDHALRLVADELTPREPTTLSGRPEAGLDEHLSDACRRDGDPEAGQLADDPPVAPPRVLACHAKDERPSLGPDPRTTRPPARIGPMTGDQPPMPTKQSLREDEETRTSATVAAGDRPPPGMRGRPA